MVLTPFLLMGAMSPVAIPAALAQQLAEALTGIALAQLIRPGCPVIFGSFLSNIDMQSGSPSFGTPESAIGLLCTGQLARHYGLPFRTGGGLNSSQTPDAQAAYEALMTLLPTFLAGTNFVMHAAGWLEGGLVSCYEKFIIDIELLRMLRVEFTPLEIDEASLAFGAHEEVGHGGHFLGAAHTMERFRTCFYRPLLSSTANYERWLKQGGKDATVRAGRSARQDPGGVRAAAAGRGGPCRTGGLRHPPPRRTGRLVAAGGPADLVLTGGAVYTVDAARSWTQAVAVKDGRIVAVGTDAGMRPHVGPRTEVVNLRGRMLLPGFQDAHVHASGGGLERSQCDLTGVHTREGYLAAICSDADRNPGAAWIAWGGGWGMDVFPGGVPGKDDLDAVVPDRPVFLSNRDHHGAWVNSRALALAGIDASTPDPPDGRIERTATGEPQGTLHEGVMGT